MYIQGYGDPLATYTVMNISVFAQDQWRLARNVTLQAGVRYQSQFWPDRQYQAPVLGRYPIHADRNDVAPRASVTWDPSGSGDLSIHSAYGMYYDNIITALIGLVDVVNGTTGVRNVVLRFPQSVSGWNARGHRLPESSAGSSPNLVAVLDPDRVQQRSRYGTVDSGSAAPIRVQGNLRSDRRRRVFWNRDR